MKDKIANDKFMSDFNKEKAGIIKKLGRFGLVKTCKMVSEDVVTIILTDGFSCSAIKTFEFIGECQKCYPNHTVLETCVTEDNLAIIVLKKPTP